MLKVISLCFLLFFCTGELMADKRKLSTTVNPGCPDKSCDTTKEDSPLFVHVRADGDNDTLHHVWDFTDTPSLLIVLTSNNTELKIVWDKYLKNNGTSIIFSTEPIYVLSVVFDKVFEFNDENNTGKFDNHNTSSDYVSVLSLKDNFHWKLEQDSSNDSNTALLAVIGTRHDHALNKTSVVRISMGAYGGVDHESTLPRLLHSSNCSQMDISLERMPTKFQNSRYGVSLIVVTSDESNATMKLDMKQTLDDENDPGVFTIAELTSPGARVEQHKIKDNDTDVVNGGYLQWRPIAYNTRTIRHNTNSSDTIQYDVLPLKNFKRLENTVVYKLFGNEISEHLISTTNVTFGNSQDKFYSKTEFVSWTFVAGIGLPMNETFSSSVLLMIVLGLGVPIILVILGVVILAIRRLIKNKDDLFLSQ